MTGFTKDLVLHGISEADLQDTVIGMARALGYLVYHSQTSRRSEPGFLDLVLVSQYPKRPRLLFLELKAEKGRLSKGRYSPRTNRYLPGQEDWLDALGRLGPPVEVMVLYPHDLDKLEEILRA